MPRLRTTNMFSYEKLLHITKLKLIPNTICRSLKDSTYSTCTQNSAVKSQFCHSKMLFVAVLQIYAIFGVLTAGRNLWAGGPSMMMLIQRICIAFSGFGSCIMVERVMSVNAAILLTTHHIHTPFQCRFPNKSAKIQDEDEVALLSIWDAESKLIPVTWQTACMWLRAHFTNDS